MRSRIFATVSLALALMVPTQALAADPASAGVVYKALQDALEQVQEVAHTAGSEVKGIANQLEIQIKELLAVMDDRLKNRINESFDRLDESQKLLTRNAQQSVDATLEAITGFREGTTEDAKELINEANITAFDALYSLPCRDRSPRVLYSTPDDFRVGTTQPGLLTLRGNYLRIGTNKPTVKLNGATLPITSLNDREISFTLPDSAITNVSKTTVLGVSVEGLERLETYNLGLWCPSFRRAVKSPIVVQVTVRPQVVHRLDVRLYGKVVSRVLKPNAYSYTHTENAGTCSTNADASKRYCLDPASNLTVGAVTLSGKYTRCKSSIGAPQTAVGDRCVVVPARQVSCGRSWGNCRGTGKLSYTVMIDGLEQQETKLQGDVARTATLHGPAPGSTAFTFTLPPGADPGSLKFSVDVETKVGTTTVRKVALTSALGYVAGYRAELDAKAGMLTVQVPAIKD